jgi:hypothetical protein
VQRQDLALQEPGEYIHKLFFIVKNFAVPAPVECFFCAPEADPVRPANQICSPGRIRLRLTASHLLIVLRFNFTSTGTGTAKKNCLLRRIRIFLLILFCFYCLGSAVAFKTVIPVPVPVIDKTGLLSPAGSGSRLI